MTILNNSWQKSWYILHQLTEMKGNFRLIWNFIRHPHFIQPAVHPKMDWSFNQYIHICTYKIDANLFSKLVELQIHELGDGFKKCSFTHSREQGILSFTHNLLNHWFFVYIFSTHEAPNSKGGETSLYPFLQKHSGDTERAGALNRNIPPIKLQKCNILFSI